LSIDEEVDGDDLWQLFFFFGGGWVVVEGEEEEDDDDFDMHMLMVMNEDISLVSPCRIIVVLLLMELNFDASVSFLGISSQIPKISEAVDS
jgi:hypothetical protein